MPPEDDEDVKTEAAFKARLRQERDKSREANARILELEKQLAEVDTKAKTVDTLAEQLKAEQKAHADSKAAWAEQSELIDAGFNDPEGRDIARMLHGRLPEKDRPKLGDWAKAQAADATKAPKALAAYLPAAGKGGAPPAGGGKGDPKPAAGKGGTGLVPGGPGVAAGQGKYRPEDVRAMREKAQKTGDWTEYKQHEPAILAQLANPTTESS